MLQLKGRPVVSEAEQSRNIAYVGSLGLGSIPAGSGRMAVVGSGHSLPAYEETLRRWDGEIWAVNGAWKWLRERGIKSALFSVHPTASIMEHLDGLGPGDHAILATQTDRAVIDRAVASGARVSVYLHSECACSCSAVSAAYRAIIADYASVTFFGSDLNFSEGKQHLTHEVGFRPLMLVKCGDEEYMTTPGYYAQALEIISLLKSFPTVFRERSAGLLRAMLEGPWDARLLAGEPVCDISELDSREIYGVDRLAPINIKVA